MIYSKMSKQELQTEQKKNQKLYDEFVALRKDLDMSRGKPSNEQLNIANELLSCVTESDVIAADGTDCRNYGGLYGIPEMRELFAELFRCPPKNVIVGDNSSLRMMYDIISQGMSHGFDGEAPWAKQGKDKGKGKIKFLCPAPGYDRHFAITEYFGIENIPVAMTKDGPDMDMVEKLVKDPLVKGMWCVPKYSNPDGYTYSDKTVERIAALRPAAPDFKIMWDDAYSVHHLYDDRQDALRSLFKQCERVGNDDIFFHFMSTSKITFAGGGVCAVCASDDNIKQLTKRMQIQSIGPDKINQMRHYKFLKSAYELKEKVMRRHASILLPKFEAVLERFEQELTPAGIGSWTNPSGGYFISYFAPGGCAKRIVELCKAAGLVITPAGAAFPYGDDPSDSHIRIAPSFPLLNDLETAVRLFVVCCKIAYADKLLG